MCIPHHNVAIIILNWNGLEDTLECLDSIRICSYQNYEIVVVDNGSTDNSVEVISMKYPWVTIIQNTQNLGFTGGNNVGIRYACERNVDYVWLLNNDTVIKADTLCRLVEDLEKDPRAGMASPLLYFYDKRDEPQYKGCYFDFNTLEIIAFDATSALKVKDDSKLNNVVLYGTALLIKMDVIDSVGLLDDRFFAYAEDADYSLRVLNAGYKNIISVDSIVYHKNSRATGSTTSPLQTYLRIRNRYLFLSKYQKKGKLDLFIKFNAFTFVILGYMGRDNKSSLEAGIDGYYDALYGKYGSYDKINRKYPFKKILNFLLNWHPYLCADLLNGYYSKIWSTFYKQMTHAWRASP